MAMNAEAAVRTETVEYADGPVSVDAVKAFVEEMRAAKVDYEVIIYGGAAHGFTNLGSAAYNEPADRRS